VFARIAAAVDPAERMDHHHVERRGLARARLNVGLGELIAARLAIRLALPRRRDAQIEGGALRHGHAGNLLISSQRPEQFVEHVAEPRFEYIHLGIRDRHLRGPVVHDAPCLNVVFDRAAKVRPGAGHDIEIGRQFAERGAVAPRGAVPGH
jgi:hypothetical protein